MNYGSLFSGIGGFDLGFERVGMTCRWQCEIDKAAQSVLRNHFGVEVYNDVRTIGRDTGAVDLICGGFPCQDVSIAGKRKGLAGERSGLWFEFARVIEELNPRWVVIENVPGLLSSNDGRDFAVILQRLVKLGYGVCWRILDAQFFGVPQRRRRLFIVASLGNGDAAKVLFESEGLRGDTPTREIEREAITTASGKDTFGTLAANVGTKQWLGNQEALSGDYHIIQLANSGANQNNVKVSNVSDTVDTWNTQAVAFQQNTRDEVRLMGGNGRYAGALAAEPGAKQQNYIAYKIRGGKEGGGKGFLGSEKTPFSLTGFNDQYLGVRRLTPVECERLQGFPDGWTEGQADTQRYKQLGNAVAVPVIEWIGKRIMRVP